MTPLAKTLLVKTLGQGVGFDLVGVTRAVPLAGADYYREWLAAGYGGTMDYLKRNVHLRAHPAGLLPGARSIICGGVNYKRPDGYLGSAAVRDQGLNNKTDCVPTGLVAQYARGRDYHVVLRAMFTTLLDRLRRCLSEASEARIFVDTGPVLERELAAAAGLGWIGKNTCLLNRRFGSYLFLGEAITTLDLTPDEPVAEACASCVRCLEACHTGAFIGPHKLDASRCIAYLTIENRGPVPGHLRTACGERVFGCDVCQQVCPHNALTPLATHPELVADIVPPRLDLQFLSKLRSGEYRRLTRGSATARATRVMWRRNADVALGNIPDGIRHTGTSGGGPEEETPGRRADHGLGREVG